MTLLKNVRQSLEKMLAAGKAGNADLVISLRSENEKANHELSKFRETYLMSELGT